MAIKAYLKRSYCISESLLRVIRWVTKKELPVNARSLSSEPVFLQDGHNATFFGYHDKTPYSSDGDIILGCSVAGSDKDRNTNGRQMTIGYFEGYENAQTPKFTPLANTVAWSWQQGCMLQWFPGQRDRHIMFNAVCDGQYISRVLDVQSRQTVIQYDYPIYALSKNSRRAVSLNFSRLARLRPGYGYTTVPDVRVDEGAPNNDGLFVINLDTGESELVVSLRDLALQAGAGNSTCHYINHANFSPSGTRIIFFHLWMNAVGERCMRLVVHDLEESKTFELERRRRVSHYCWIDDERILATVASREGNGWRYVTYSLGEGVAPMLLTTPLSTDGHPMMAPGSKSFFVSDLRLDKRREDSAVIGKLESNEIIEVARFAIPWAYSGEVRCDLHPRWDWEGKKICVDAVRSNRRCMVSIDLRGLFDLGVV